METTNTNKIVKRIVIGVLSLIAVIVFFGSFYTIESGERGIVTTFGKISEDVMEDGLHFKIPIVQDINKIDIRIQALPVDELAYSKDSQIIQAQATVNYQLDNTQIKQIYLSYRKEIKERVVVPAIKESIKVAISSYTAQGLIDNREKVAFDIRDNLIERLASKGVLVSGVAISNLDFDDAYENAVKDKQVQAQNALKQENITKQEEEKKKQDILKAQALSEKTRLEVQALANSQGEKIIEKIYAEAALEAAKKWNGQLPTQMIPGGTLPFINLTR